MTMKDKFGGNGPSRNEFSPRDAGAKSGGKPGEPGAGESAEEKLVRASVNRRQAETERQRVANQILESSKALARELIAEAERTLLRARHQEAEAAFKRLEARKTLDRARAIRAEADSYREGVMREARAEAQEFMEEACSTARRECEELRQQAYLEIQLAQSEAEAITAAAQEEIETRKLRAEATRLEAESRELVSRVKGRFAPDGSPEEPGGPEPEEPSLGPGLDPDSFLLAGEPAQEEHPVGVVAEDDPGILLAEDADLFAEANFDSLLTEDVNLFAQADIPGLPMEGVDLFAEADFAGSRTECVNLFDGAGPAGLPSEECDPGEADRNGFTAAPSEPVPATALAEAQPATGVAAAPSESELSGPVFTDYERPEETLGQAIGFPVEADTGVFIPGEEPVLGLHLAGAAKAYPFQAIGSERVINDSFSGNQVAVTFDPASGAYVTFSRRVAGRVLTFQLFPGTDDGVMLIQDRETDTVWQSLTGRALRGPLEGLTLRRLPSYRCLWSAWQDLHPETETYPGS